MRLLCVLAAAGLAFAQLPTSFNGVWTGVPAVTPLGPWDEPYVFVIGNAGDGTGQLMYDAMSAQSDVIPDSWQRFWVSNTTNALTYCGAGPPLPAYVCLGVIECACLGGWAWVYFCA